MGFDWSQANCLVDKDNALGTLVEQPLGLGIV